VNATALFKALDSEFSVAIPVEPMLGTVGVAPKALEVRNALVPDAFGGNMDSPEVRAGTTIYLGVNVDGALFSLGDGHYAQSEGETCGVAVEGAMSTTCVVDVIKSTYVEWPRLEDERFIMVAGSVRPLEDAYRIAYTQLVRWLASDYGLSTMDAYQLVSQVAKTGVANVVDTNYTVLAKFPKRYLPPAGPAMGGVHAKTAPHRRQLRQLRKSVRFRQLLKTRSVIARPSRLSNGKRFVLWAKHAGPARIMHRPRKSTAYNALRYATTAGYEPPGVDSGRSKQSYRRSVGRPGSCMPLQDGNHKVTLRNTASPYAEALPPATVSGEFEDRPVRGVFQGPRAASRHARAGDRCRRGAPRYVRPARRRFRTGLLHRHGFRSAPTACVQR
jgi:hypothetical protein